MPHILIHGCDINRTIKVISIHASVDFKNGLHKTAYGQRKIDELREELEKVVEKYFDTISSDELTNHEWNIKNRM